MTAAAKWHERNLIQSTPDGSRSGDTTTLQRVFPGRGVIENLPIPPREDVTTNAGGGNEQPTRRVGMEVARQFIAFDDHGGLLQCDLLHRRM